ncbi:MAG: DUF4307 domain-containing protein [Microbacterium sp.]|uniref:DUF4307 domain-containing protein n=1 Tax=Microbacterium sp. TaxID=51671 RepID=UPI001AC5FDD5|nr:DUF4307 domain-containing protein [Microbacterium sp.]MBN9153193.1 DUF4307 domain-containing protein [Microbacterium sp.]MBN9171481.1 DUF4307 domain-containing protein [Microbacterium sp.]
MTTQEMLDERYGRHRSRGARATTWIVASILVAAAVAVVTWLTFANSSSSVDAAATGYTVQDARSVSLRFQVTAPIGSTVVCALEADDEEHGIVGWKIVRYPASATHSVAYAETIPTVGEATTGLVNSCWVA